MAAILLIETRMPTVRSIHVTRSVSSCPSGWAENASPSNATLNNDQLIQSSQTSTLTKVTFWWFESLHSKSGKVKVLEEVDLKDGIFVFIACDHKLTGLRVSKEESHRVHLTRTQSVPAYSAGTDSGSHRHSLSQFFAREERRLRSKSQSVKIEDAEGQWHAQGKKQKYHPSECT